MTAKQRKKILKIVENDCTITCRYFRGKNDACVIGGLLIAAGLRKRFENDIINEFENGAAIGGYNGLVIKMRREIEATYGLSKRDLIKLQEINDSEPNTKKRRSRITDFIMSLPLESA